MTNISSTSQSIVNFNQLRTPDFTRLQDTLFGRRADAVPLLELGIHPNIKKTILGRPVLHVGDDIEFMSSLGYDYVKIQPVIRFGLERTQASSEKSAGADTIAWAAEHGGVIQTMADFEKFPWPRKEDIEYRSFEHAARILPDNMRVIGQYGDIFTTALEMMGFENFALAIYDEPELVKALMDKVGDLILSMFDTMIDMEIVGALWYSDDIAYTSGLMINPSFYREHFFPKLKHIGDLARRRNIPFLYHTDGVLWEVFDDIIACGVTAQHPIEPLAMDIEEVKARVGDRLCLCGNIDVDLLARGTPQQITDLVRRRILGVGQDGGYCLGSSNSVPNYARVENYLAMVKAGLEIGRFGA